jgi:hypothetical protein
MYPYVRSLASLCLILLVVTAARACSPETKAQAAPAQGDSSAALIPGTVNINVTIDALSNRHPISSYVYGGAYPQDAPTITDSGLTVVRWGGNATSRYNWKLFTYNAANDY